MKINRWTAEVTPTIAIIHNIYKTEGLESNEVDVISGAKLTRLRTSMTEIIQIVQGELIFNLSGNQFALRAGDRIEIPANTVYSYNNLKSDNCCFLTAYRL